MSTPVVAQTVAAAASASVSTAPQAADSGAAAPPVPYRSPFTGYQAFSDPAIAPWRDTNERVRQRGGWRAYAREANAPASPPASAPARTPALPDAGRRMQ